MKIKTNVKLKFEPRDLWIGIYWDYDRIGTIHNLRIYLCIIPMLPIRFSFVKGSLLDVYKNLPPMPSEDER